MKAQDAELEAWLNANPAFRLGITGSRDWRDRRSVYQPLDRLLRHYHRLIVRNGKCRKGLDRLVGDWSDRFPDHLVKEDPYEADWQTFGNRAGFLRNGVMVKAGMDLLMVWANPCSKRTFWCPPGEHPSHGTADCVKQARAAGIHIRFSPEGMSW